MREKVKILTCCSHFDDIVNFDFLEDDLLTKRLIQYYQDYIFKVDEGDDSLTLIKQLDEAIYKYMDDYRFAKSLKDTLDVDLIVSDNFQYLDQLMKYIVDFFGTYDESSTASTPTRWI
ncbi:MAG: hypothetical protein PHI22_00290 [Bacilli bacterium]|nr:hypothetical protein [Bacilli bacterium]MDD4298305.1 hypothetical protein [Bacilli bacterium]MDD4644156.1 hypothetical protein [Bacilli bacterium]